MNVELKNRTALICGATKGIGRAIAEAFCFEGANVTILARNSQTLEKVRAEISQKFHTEIHTLSVDTGNSEELRIKIREYINSGSAIQILVNNSGGPEPGILMEDTPEKFEKYFRQHLIANQILAQELIPGMKNMGYGRIINIISTSVKQPIKGLGVSNAIRHAVAAWAKTLSLEIQHPSITINNILPGATYTERLKEIIIEKAARLKKKEEVITQEMLSEIPLGRFATPDEIANLACFLASPLAGYINGASIPVDGGRTACV